MIVDAASRADDAMALGRRVGRSSASRPPAELGHTAAVTASIGVAVGDHAGYDAESLRSADTAMYRAKQQGRCRVEL